MIGIFAGFGILLLVASPLLLLAAPCIVCCKDNLKFFVLTFAYNLNISGKCRICSGAAKMEQEADADYDDAIGLQR